MKSKILILSDYPVDLTSVNGGVQASTAGLLEGLRGFRDEFDFIVVNIQKSHQDHFTERERIHYHFLGLPLDIIRPRSPMRIFALVRHMKRLSPDLIHCQGNLDMALAAIWSNYPKLFTIHGIRRREAEYRTGWERWAARADAFLEPYVYRHFQDFVCVSDYVRNFIGGEKRTYGIPNAVRSTFFSVERQYSFETPLFLFVGVLSPLKGVEDLIAAHCSLRSQFPNLQTIFCGLPETPAYERHLREIAGVGIRFVGLVNKDELKQWLSIATALVLPSWQENAPMAIAEAMAVGVPIVATRVGGIPEMVDEGKTGMLFVPGDIKCLTMCLEKFLLFPLLVEEYGAHGKILALSKYHPDRVARQIVDVYRALMMHNEKS